MQPRPVFGFEYRSELGIGDLPFIHICSGIDPVTMRPRVDGRGCDAAAAEFVRHWIGNSLLPPNCR